MQTTLSVSFGVLVVLAVGACSSEATSPSGNGGNGNGNGNGNGGSTTTTAGTGGSSAQSGAGGGRTDGGTSSAALDCANKPVTCSDDHTALVCNPDTLMDESFDCTQGVAKLGPGLVSDGCITDPTDSGCSYHPEDTACADGASAFAACYRAATGDEIDDLDAYVACFTDRNGLKAIIPCFTQFVNTAENTVDCSAAEMGCFPDDGAGGAGGAGG